MRNQDNNTVTISCEIGFQNFIGEKLNCLQSNAVRNKLALIASYINHGEVSGRFPAPYFRAAVSRAYEYIAVGTSLC